MVDHLMEWEEIKEKIQEGRFDELGRLPEVEACYQEEVAAMRNDFLTIGDLIMNREFGFALLESENGLKRAIIPENQEKVIKFSDSLYPYALVKGISQSLIWSTHQLSNEELVEICEKNKPSTQFESLFYVNRGEIQSVKNVYHAHVFWREKPQNC